MRRLWIFFILTVLICTTIVLYFSGQQAPPVKWTSLRHNSRPFPPSMMRLLAPDDRNGTCTSPTATESEKPLAIGFMMAMHYSDQMTGSSGNLMNLQCFVGHHIKDVKVVEPFLNPFGSVFGVSLSPSYSRTKFNLKPVTNLNTVKLSDILDIHEWQDYARSRRYAPLISWDNFLKNSPKDIILVHHVWHRAKDAACNGFINMTEATKQFIVENNFEVIRNVCMDFRKTGVLSPQKFIDTLYGPFKPNEVAVVFNRWGGTANGVENFRYAIRGTPCDRGAEIRLYHHSKLILNDVREYSMKFMNESRRYTAVMVRLEHFAINHKLSRLPAESQRTKLNECFDKITQKVTSLKQERKISNTLLTMDIGKHGSHVFRMGTGKSRIDIHVLNETVHGFFKMLYGNSLTQDIWEESYESVAHFNTPGYISIMQKELAANSICLLLVGGGNFQGSTQTLYNELHSGSKCVFHVC